MCYTKLPTQLPRIERIREVSENSGLGFEGLQHLGVHEDLLKGVISLITIPLTLLYPTYNYP